MKMQTNRVKNTTGAMMIFVIVLTVVYSPFVVMDIIKRARKRVPVHIMALQWLDPTTELRVLIGLHGPHNIGSSLNLMEICHGGREPGSVFYATDMVELTDEIAATLKKGGGGGQSNESVTITDRSVTEMRESITAAVNGYGELRSGQGVTVRRMLALSTFMTMAHDICGLADELMVSIIILPFHKRRNPDGSTLDSGHAGFRHVNRKVKTYSSKYCSVAFLSSN